MFHKVSQYWALQVKEISTDRSLQIYGMLLCLPILSTAYFWRNQWLDGSLLTRGLVCWPYLGNCLAHPIISLGKVGGQIYWTLILGCSFSAIIGFWQRKINLALLCLISSYLLKLGWQSITYFNMGNYHYMAYIIVGVFCFSLSKQTYLRLAIVLFYFSAGLLKLNQEWLFGAATNKPIPFFPKNLEVYLFTYVVYLELVFVFFLLSANRYLRYFSFLQFIILHLFSYYYVGYFYPSVMLPLIAIFFYPPVQKSLGSIINDKENTLSNFAMALLVAAQIFPHLSGKDPALYTHWRLPALNMFDARSKCHSTILLTQENTTFEYLPNFSSHGVRVQCDPIIFESYAKQACQDLSNQTQKRTTAQLLLLAKRTTDKDYQIILDEEYKCESNI